MITRLKTAFFLVFGLGLVLMAPSPIVLLLVSAVVIGAIEEAISILFAKSTEKVSIIQGKLPHQFTSKTAIQSILLVCLQCALLSRAWLGEGAILQIAALLWAIYAVSAIQYVKKHNTYWKEMNISALLICLVTSAFGFVHLQKDNIWLLITVITLTALSDSAGLIVGKLIGKKKVFPLLSPNKTEFGTLAMLILPGVIMFSYCQWSGSDMSLLFILLGPLALLGDLWVSRIKRLADAKDTGTLLPGHGGILDRMDSHILTLSFAYLWSGLG